MFNSFLMKIKEKSNKKLKTCCLKSDAKKPSHGINHWLEIFLKSLNNIWKLEDYLNNCETNIMK